MKLNGYFLSTALFLFASFATHISSNAQDKFSIAPIGRIHVDGALYAPDANGFHAGASLPEIRAGALAQYGNWLARIEVGYSYGRIGMKDVYIQRAISDKDCFRLGYFIPQFGIRGGGSASAKPAMVPQISESFYRTMTRKIGLSYTRSDKDYLISGTAFVGGRSLTFTSSEQGKVSAGGAVRAVWRPITDNGNVVQLGVSSSYETASYTRLINDAGDEKASAGYRVFSANFPTTVSSVAMLQADLSDIKGDWKISPELVLATNRFALESQFYYMAVPRNYNLSTYSSVGAFGMVRCLVFGDNKYSYTSEQGTLSTPSPKTLEIVAGYNYTNADCKSAAIKGGICNDWSLTANYYINKYMMARLRYSYTNVKNSTVRNDGGENIIQARLQFVF